MKKGIHPSYQKLKLRIKDEVFETMSASKEGEILMDVDFRNHPAWTKKGVSAADQTNQNISAFNQRFSGINFGAK